MIFIAVYIASIFLHTDQLSANKQKRIYKCFGVSKVKNDIKNLKFESDIAIIIIAIIYNSFLSLEETDKIMGCIAYNVSKDDC